MPACKICRERIDVSKTGVRAYRCEVCGKMFCKDHFLLQKGICVRCAGWSEEEIAQVKRVKRFGSFVRKQG
jgi:predicted nucleic acid binding AN1-type Zn finger protein